MLGPYQIHLKLLIQLYSFGKNMKRDVFFWYIGISFKEISSCLENNLTKLKVLLLYYNAMFRQIETLLIF